MTRPPLNGTKTHPLSDHALGVLRSLVGHAIPASEINPGIINRLERESLIFLEDRPSPYRTHKGKKIPFAVITQAGRNRSAN